MDQQQPRWMPRWPQPWPNGSDHNPLILENRLTKLEMELQAAKGQISRLEKLALLFVGALNIVAHDKIPEWAKYLSMLIKAAM